jgi:hypothetical protein
VTLAQDEMMGDEELQDLTKNLQNIVNLDHANLVVIDKLTSKKYDLKLNIEELKTFGDLELRVIKCVKVKEQLNNYWSFIELSELDQLIFSGWINNQYKFYNKVSHPIFSILLASCE